LKKRLKMIERIRRLRRQIMRDEEGWGGIRKGETGRGKAKEG
jgi:hypothetical protein